ncbi:MULTISPECIES: amino acid permease [unclassified Enterococcus]|uniref:amino acid permease n=1 Tax=unclassified Enterococcus TaxID=2608891 RepID=UPI001553B462|nr:MULTISPECIES: amino acid permease [unclassified Enterococcus]MBS7576404.1 amino acid permease [Enterococcus sp. MMGLQ5-2]MBS7583636.1 amino acid permease [Enterococcus sp. MMGLQ5-1]NPD11497.1 amino acid permease [Enterococcus sp. MMGLQ5-1]NPD36241.1 amino acid permease [Enterococcus sp. MMGLQ5-2]
MEKKQAAISFQKIVLIIATTVFSFSSSTTAFFTMGLHAVPWLAMAAIFYFVPFAIINSEFTSAYPNSKGSLYQWLSENLSQRLAFITSFIWYSSYFIWMMSLFLKLWIPFSVLIFGYDISKLTTIFGVSTKWVLTILSLIGVLIMTWIINHGFIKIIRCLYLSGILMVGLVALTVISNLILAIRHPEQILPNLSSSINTGSFFETQNLTGILSQLPFFIFAITAFGGLDTVSSLVDKLGNQQNKFSKAVLLGGFFVLLLYFLDILSWAIGSNFASVRQLTNQHLGNLMYGLMSLLSNELSQSFKLSAKGTHILNQAYIRYTALTLFTAYIGLLATIGYAPLKVLISSTGTHFFQPRLYQENRYGVLSRAINIQAAIISLFVLALSLGTPFISSMYNQLTLMTNLSRSLPYFLIALAYPFFKRNFQGHYLNIIQKKWQIRLLMCSVMLSISLAIVFEIYATWLDEGWLSVFFLLVGPVGAFLIANQLYQRKILKEQSTIQLLKN